MSRKGKLTLPELKDISVNSTDKLAKKDKCA